MYGGNFNEDEENKLKESLKKFHFSKKKLKKVMETLSLGSTCFHGRNNLKQLTQQIEAYNERKKFMDWLEDDTRGGYTYIANNCDDTDNEYDDDDDDEDDDF